MLNRRDFAKTVAASAATAAYGLHAAQPDAGRSYDLVVYGGTASGVMTAVSGARQGLKVALLEPGRHVGGMVTGGLSRTDVGRREVIGGMALEFYMRLGRRYHMAQHLHSVAWLPEPHVAESVLLEMLAGARVPVFYDHQLKEKDGVVKSGGRIRSIVMSNGARFTAAVFADCSYEGDLMAQAGVSYTVGREPVSQYGESLAGIRAETPKHQFRVNVPAFDRNGNLYPEISPEPKGKPGDGDKRVQAYNFRVIATDDPNLRVPWPQPDGYDPKRYELLALMLEAEYKRLGDKLTFNEVVGIGRIPNRKADFNNKGAFSTDYIGKNYDYPDGGYARRKEIWDDHVRYVQGFFYFLAHDPRVPRILQYEARQWGLSRDEFEDNGYWPHQLYIREGRRMIGAYVMKQQDLQSDLTKPDVIGMGSYNSDSHNVQRFRNEKGFAENEGDVQVAVKPYQIPYRVMLPKPEECFNLLVPVCLSASHVAYSSIRMEPQYMLIGHAAGVAAKLAVAANKPVHEINVKQLQTTLLDEGGVFEYNPIPQWSAIGKLAPKLNH